jgi:hypothetical protein
MTATVDPGAYAEQIVRNDVDLRIQDYLAAIKFWAAYPDPRIKGVVFCENSGVKVHALEAAAAEFSSARAFEVLSFQGNTPPAWCAQCGANMIAPEWAVHYGYAELGTIDYACLNSSLLRKYRYFIKVSGRLVFPKLTSVINSLGDDTLAVVDFRRAYRKEGGIRLKARTQIMFFEREFYEQVLLGRRVEMLGSSCHIEEFLAQKLLPLYQKQRPGIYLRFKMECPAVGYSAADNKNYAGIPERFKCEMRSLLRRLLPSLWL